MFALGSVGRRVRAALVASTLALMLVVPQPARAEKGEDEIGPQDVFFALYAAFFMSNCKMAGVALACADPVNHASIKGKQGTTSQVSIWTPMIPIELSPKLVVAPVGAIGRSKFSWDRLAVRTDTDIGMVGLMVAFNPFDSVVVEILGVHGRLSTQYNRGTTALVGPAASGHYISTVNYWQVLVSRRIDMGNYSITPAAGFTRGQINKKPWVESAFSTIVAGSTMVGTRTSFGGTINVPMWNWIAACRDKAAVCNSNDVFVGVTGYYGTFTGIQPDNAAVLIPKERYFGFMAVAGANVALTSFAEIGGRAGWMDAGDSDGYFLQGVLTIRFSELLGWKKDQPRKH